MNTNDEQKPYLIIPHQWREKEIILTSDHHGDWVKLKRKIDYLEIKDCIIITCGDLGVGFATRQQDDALFDALNVWFENRNILFLGIRGNHDFPARFDGSVNLSNFKLLQDYTYATIQGKRWGFIGGAISVDRCDRVKDISWWEDEKLVFQEDLIQKCDILCCHLPPWWLGPYDKNGIRYWLDKEKSINKYNHNKPLYPDFVKRDLWEECKIERQQMSEIIRLSECKQFYCGHMHCFSQIEQGGCLGRIVDILEFVEYREFIP